MSRDPGAGPAVAPHRPWVETEEGRAGQIGQPLACVRCLADGHLVGNS